jgi:hypothetical protein
MRIFERVPLSILLWGERAGHLGHGFNGFGKIIGGLIDGGAAFKAPFAILLPPEEICGVHRVFLAQLHYGGVSLETLFGDPLL